MKRFFYDFEFIEDGVTIDPISIGIVCDDSRTYYAVFKDAPWYAIRRNMWLMNNVVRHLPHDRRLEKKRDWVIDMTHADVKMTSQIADEVRDFLIGANEPIELWGYYPAYDHVALAQLWGPMMKLPKGIPMWTNCVWQEAYLRECDDRLPEQPANLHNALADAQWTYEAWQWLETNAPRYYAIPHRTTE